MISKAPDVQAYLQQIPEPRRQAIDKLHLLCTEILTGYEECMEYGMPCFKRDGRVEVAFASQKQYISLYVLKEPVVEEFRSALPTASIGKGCIRFTRPEKINFPVIEQMLHRTVQSRGVPC